MTKTCKTCRFFDTSHPPAEIRKLMEPEWQDHGACRRYPAHIENAKAVQPDDWCGEWLA